MRRSPVWPICVCLLLVGATPTFGVDGSLPAETPGLPTETAGFVVVMPGLEAVAALARASTGAAVATIVVDQRVVGNRVEEQNISRSTLFENSGRDNFGIVNINQDAGNLNNQANVTVLAILQGGTHVGSAVHGLDVAPTAARADNTAITSGGHRENRIASSFTGTVGLVNANQSVGNLNSQANLVALSLGVLAVPEFALLGDSALGEVAARNSVIREGPGGSRVDVVTDSFGGYRGVALVSQVSGDLNVVRNTATISVMVGTDALSLTATAGIGR
jgi:hypothetical protein